MSSSKRQLIDRLVQNLYNKEDQEWNSSTILALNFIFPNTLLSAIKLIDDHGIKIYKPFKTVNNADQLKDCLVLITADKSITTVDLESWYCTCSKFAESHKSSELMDGTTANESHHAEIYKRFGRFFRELEGRADTMPICEHLLALYVIYWNYETLSRDIEMVEVGLERWLELHSLLL